MSGMFFCSVAWVFKIKMSSLHAYCNEKFCNTEKLSCFMNKIKNYILLLLIFTSCVSQRQGLLSSVVYDSGRTSYSMGNFITVKDEIYYCGGKPCEGFYTDYYDENERKIRITGKFKSGKPVGEVRGYYENGVVKFSYIPNNKKSYRYYGRKYNYCLYREYDEQGNCLRCIDDKKGLERKYRQDGSLKSVLYYYRKSSSVKYYVEYYPDNNKQTVIMKGNKYDYDESGRLRRHWVRKSEKYDKKRGTMSATIYFVEYDVQENISKSGRFYTNLYEHDYWLHISPEFPASLDSVPLQDFKEITNHQLGIKDVYKWDYANNKTIIITYKRQGDIWLETERKSVSRIIQ